jgi:hypothetical protein
MRPSQQRLFDPYADERAQRPRGPLSPLHAEQLVLDVLARAGGTVRGGTLVSAALDAGIGIEELTAAVDLLVARRRITADSDVISLAA